MSAWLIIFVGCIYAYVAAEQAYLGNWPMVIVYGCYAGANVGLWMLAR